MLTTAKASLYDVIVLYVGQPYMINLVYAHGQFDVFWPDSNGLYVELTFYPL
jgi:hypothetical protein